MKLYNTHILPRLTHWVCARKNFDSQRKKVVPLARGRILEIGMGSGLNLPFYDPSQVEHLYGLEPSDALRKMAEKNAACLPFPVGFIGLPGEEIPLETNSMDTVLVTYTLCTIPDIHQALGQMRRVLKPGGRLLFCEHGLAPDPGIRQWQERFNPVWNRISGGCSLNRPISDLITHNGFVIQAMSARYQNAVKITSFTYRGIAVPA
ncbi:MAG: class I SAM-dependent methyltransferase [Desulfotignum sp.]|jgi:ubiquinone/menaquinone biosynthesis C-methylase UbiE|nr:class I SAM-dependent methyltransferase [Desulfotignum sp.]